MGKLIVLLEKEVSARGINPYALPQPAQFQHYLFVDDYQLLTAWHPSPLFHQEVTMLYPGCGADILYPLLFLDKLFPRVKQGHLYFVDILPSLGIIKTILDDLGISFEESKGALTFYWYHKYVMLTFVQGDIFTLLETIPHFDVYFEHAFRIMKDQHPSYEQNIYDKVKPGGVIISDSGFSSLSLKLIPVPQKLSAYEEMMVGIKQ